MNKKAQENARKQMCVCHNGCTKFDDKSCEIGQVVYTNDINYEVVTPMTECESFTGDKSIFEELKKNRDKILNLVIEKHS